MSVDAVSYPIAVGAITSPLWLTNLGQVASNVVPILGALWLIVQIADKVARWFTTEKEEN